MAIGRVPGATGIQPSIVDAKGDLIAATAADSVSRLAAGSNNQVLMADSAQATGLKYANEATATLTTTGDILYASAANTPARLAIGSTSQVLTVSGGIPAWAAASGFVGCALYDSNVNQAVAANTWTAINWNSEYFDSDAFHSTSTNTSRITIPSGKDGKYLWTASVFSATINNVYNIAIYKNGTIQRYAELYGAASGFLTSWFSYIVDGVAGDFFQVYVKQSTAGSINYHFNGLSAGVSNFSCTYLGA